MSSGGGLLPKGGAHAQRMAVGHDSLSVGGLGGAREAYRKGGGPGDGALSVPGKTDLEALSRERSATGESGLPAPASISQRLAPVDERAYPSPPSRVSSL